MLSLDSACFAKLSSRACKVVHELWFKISNFRKLMKVCSLETGKCDCDPESLQTAALINPETRSQMNVACCLKHLAMELPRYVAA